MNESIQTTILGSKILQYRVRVSSRARRLRITVSASGVTVTLPQGVPQREAEKFLKANSQWVTAQMERASKVKKVNQLPEDVILWHGTATQMVRVEEEQRKSHIKVEERMGKLHVYLPLGSRISTRRAAETWMRAAARSEIENMVAQQARRMHANPKTISIRDQRTRWGSCSSKGGLSFNWRLIMTPPAVMEYVVIHELAHLFEPNHSVDFWNIVARYFPDYKKARLWLKRNASAMRIAE